MTGSDLPKPVWRGARHGHDQLVGVLRLDLLERRDHGGTGQDSVVRNKDGATRNRGEGLYLAAEGASTGLGALADVTSALCPMTRKYAGVSDRSTQRISSCPRLSM